MKTGLLEQATDDLELAGWLTNAGFSFNPFVHLDAGGDTRLSAYLIMHDAFAPMWGDWPSLVFAPPGGGKTALRVQLMRACWFGPDRGYPFPIPYLPAINADGELPVALAEHLQAIVQSGVQQLFLALLFRPHWWVEADKATQRLIKGLLVTDLSLPYYLSRLQDTENLLLFLLDQELPLLGSEAPSAERWHMVCDEIEATKPALVANDPQQRLNTLVEILLGPLQRSAIYLLTDGIDGFQETGHNPQGAIALLQPLLEQIPIWTQQKIFFKGFLPDDILPLLRSDYATLLKRCHYAAIRWNESTLAQMLRQRVYAATAGIFGSLDALSAPDLMDTETQIVRSIKPLPREALMLTQRLLWEHLNQGNDANSLCAADLAAAREWYQQQPIPPLA